MPRENKFKRRKVEEQADEPQFALSESTSTAIHPSRRQNATYIQPNRHLEHPQTDFALSESTSSAIHPSRRRNATYVQPNQQVEEPQTEFPLIDPDTKAYFKGLDERMQELQRIANEARRIRSSRKKTQQTGDAPAGEEEDGDDMGQDSKLLLQSALSSLQNHELSLATDPETSIILERLLHSMDPFALRVLADRFLAHRDDSAESSWLGLAQHRFGSHVVQTLLVQSSGVMEKEWETHEVPMHSSLKPEQAGQGSKDKGTLRSMTELFLAVCEDLLPKAGAQLMSHSFGSHILRTVLSLLSGKTELPESNRSKKSAQWKAQQGPLSSFIVDGESPEGNKAKTTRKCPESFDKMLQRYSGTLAESMVSVDRAGNIVRAKAFDPISAPVLSLLLGIELAQWKTFPDDACGSLVDTFLSGMIAEMVKNPTKPIKRNDTVEAALRDSVASHVLQNVIENAPAALCVHGIYPTYFKGRLQQLATHPCANFLVATMIRRIDDKTVFESCVQECKAQVIRDAFAAGQGKTILELIAKGNSLKCGQADIVEAVVNAPCLPDEQDRMLISACLLSFSTFENYSYDPAYKAIAQPSTRGGPIPISASVPGALILQALLRTGQPYNDEILSSILSLPTHILLTWARDPIASRTLDVILSHIHIKARNKLLHAFIGHFQTLAGDRIGSRVADRCWAAADMFTKEKIATSLLDSELALQQSHFGHYFAKKLNLPLFRRKKDDWRARMASTDSSGATKTLTGDNRTPLKRRRKTDEDDIDAIFAQVPDER